VFDSFDDDDNDDDDDDVDEDATAAVVACFRSVSNSFLLIFVLVVGASFFGVCAFISSLGNSSKSFAESVS
jgi:hypothetical protein